MPVKKKAAPIECCPPKAAIFKRPLIASSQASELSDVFKVLANDTRLRLLHALIRAGEICVTDLAQTVGMTPQAVSNQLQRLVDRSIISSRRAGNQIFYRVVDPCIADLLDRGVCLLEDSQTRTGAKK
jgi:DNA-binding transcriptional ArsR family regulator